MYFFIKHYAKKNNKHYKLDYAKCAVALTRYTLLTTKSYTDALFFELQIFLKFYKAYY